MKPSRRSWPWILSIALWAALAGQAAWSQGQGRPGDPISGITPAEFSLFRLGLDDFLEVETAEEGLGPAFNGTSCAGCHSVPAIGGSGVVAEMRAGWRDADGRGRGLDGPESTLLHLFSIPTHGCQPALPAEATLIDRRVPIPLFGAGLVESISDDDIEAPADPDDRDRDGISGRAARVRDLATGAIRVGRFGWKAQHATLLTFGADAYRNEMGITNDVFSTEVGHGVSTDAMRLCDPIPEPEDRREPSTGRRGIDNFEIFMQLLAPIARAPVDDAVRDGERVFNSIGCAACHRPAFTTTADAPIPVLRQKVVPLFSDLLLHDVGTGDDMPQGAADGREFRTPALWGLRLRRPLLHDGRATTPEAAILHHRNEAEVARRSFERLSPAEQALLRRFLDSL
jgi:CxxC motif-containing protein (DUF1111 family)